MYYTYLKAILRVLDKRINVRERERIAKGFCVCCVIICLFVNMLVQNAGLYADEAEVVTIESNYNRLSANHNEAVIQLTKSEISRTEAMSGGAHPSNRNVVKSNDEEAALGNEANLVTENPKTLSLIQGVNADNGTQPEAFEYETRYQYPVEPGYPADQNYGGRQSAGDFILCDTFPTVSEDEQIFPNEGGIIGGSGNAEIQKADIKPATDEGLKQETEHIDMRQSVRDRELAEGVGDENGEDSAVSGNQIDEPEEEPEEQIVEEPESQLLADQSFFTVNGILNKDGTIFTSDIAIEPIGIGGYGQIRLGEAGEFSNSLLITKDAMEETLQLYFYDGENISNAVDFTYSKDSVSPVLGVDRELFYPLEAGEKEIYCTNNSRLSVSCNDLENGSGIGELTYVYGDKTEILFDNLEEPVLSLTDDFYGKVIMNCTDRAGNPSETVEEYFLVEDDAPVVSTSEGKLCTAPYTLWVDISDDGNIVSGIESMECTVNGEEFAIENPVVCRTTELYQNLKVASTYKFPIVLQEVGTYDICVTARDNAGNVTEYETQVEVQEPEMVSILMPDNFIIHIDPQRLLGKEQIFSDELVLQNMSDFDVLVNIDSINLIVKDGVSDKGIKKDCTVYLTAPDTGEKISLEKGVNEGVYSYRLPKDAQGDITRLFFSGDVTEDSDEMWEDSDISINVSLSFEKWEE